MPLTTDAKDYDFLYEVTPQGALTKVTNPSGRSVGYTYDDAGRVSSVKNAGANTPYASSFVYAAHGPVQSVLLGNGVTEAWTYNSRLQPASLTTGSLTLNYYYCTGQGASCGTNNGNLLTQAITRGASTWTQAYTYDTVNRLSTATETGTGSWNQSYGYDERGNRWLCAHGGSLPGLTLETPQNIGGCASPAGWYGTGDNKAAPSTWGYERGNVTSISGMNRTFTYDGENRQKTATINGATSTYTYDGEGHRVKAQTPAGTTIFVYDFGGQLTAEYGANSDTGTQYVTVDHLGSTRLITGTAGAVAKCYDYLPFGETIPSTAGRGGTACYGAASGNRVDFTGKERDAESGLDYFGARYMSSAQGRFTGADAPLVDQDPTDPQSWNLYSYVRNRPLDRIDPTGNYEQNANGFCLASCESPPMVRTSPPSASARIRAIGTGAFWRGLFSGGTTETNVDVISGDEVESERSSASPEERTGQEAADNLRDFAASPFGDLVLAMIPTPGPRGAKTPSQMASSLKARIGKNRVAYETPTVKGNIDLEGKAHFDKSTQTYIPTPHVQEKPKFFGPGGQMNVGAGTVRPATKADIRVAERLTRP